MQRRKGGRVEKVDIAATAHAQSYSLHPIVHASCIKTNSLLLQLSCILTSIHYMGKRITINLRTTYWGLMLITINKEPTLKCQRIMIS